MLKKTATIWGIVFLAIGILGFIPATTPNGHLFGLFEVDTVHNWVHILTGAIALLCGLASNAASRAYFQIFGVVYALVAVLGFVYQDNALLGIMAHNVADIWLHIAISLVALYIGFAMARERRTEPPVAT